MRDCHLMTLISFRSRALR